MMFVRSVWFPLLTGMALVTPFKMLRAELIPPVSGVPELGAPNPLVMSREESVNISRQDLLFADYSREGMTSHLNDPSGRYQWAVFGYQKPSTLNPQDLALQSTPAETHLGSVLDWELAGDWRLHTGYLVTRQGATDEAWGSRGWNIAADADWWDRRLTTSFEYAQSAFYPENLPVKSEVRVGDAYDARISLSSAVSGALPGLNVWQSQVQYRYANDHFYSPANPQLARGQGLARAYFQGSRDSWRVELESQRILLEQSDILGQDEAAELRSGLRLGYEPMVEESLRPSLEARYFQTASNQLGADLQRDEVGLLLSLSRDTWTLDLDYQMAAIAEQDRDSDRSTSLYQEQNAAVRSIWELPSAVRLQADMTQRDLWVADDHAPIQQFRFYGMEAQWSMISRMRLMLRYQFTRQSDYSNVGNGSETSRYHSGSAELSWSAQEARRYRPEVDVRLYSQFGNFQTDSHSVSDQQWSTYLAVDVLWGG